MTDKPKLLSEFAEVPFDKWKAQVEAELKGVPYEKKLVSGTYEGITVQPIYNASDVAGLEHLKAKPGCGQLARGSSHEGYVAEAWEVSQELPYPGPREFNQAARHDLSRGLTALNLNLDHATRAGIDPDSAVEGDVGKGGVSIATIKDLSVALEDIDLEKTSLFVRSGASGLPFAALLAALVKSRGLDVRKLRGCIEMDPLGVLAHEGTLPQSLDEAYARWPSSPCGPSAKLRRCRPCASTRVPSWKPAAAPCRNWPSPSPRAPNTSASWSSAAWRWTPSLPACASPSAWVPTSSWKSPSSAQRACCGAASWKPSAGTCARRA